MKATYIETKDDSLQTLTVNGVDFKFNTLEEIIKAVRGLSLLSYSDFIALRDSLRNHKAEVLEILGRETIASLGRYAFKDKKEHMIKSTLSAIMETFVLGGSYTVDIMRGETTEQAREKVYNSTTEADFIKWKEKREQEKAEFKKAIENPETLNEFATFIRYRGEDKLTTEQRARYDEIRADRTREGKAKEQERKNEIAAVELNGVQMTLHESRHTKKNIPLWVVSLSSRVSSDTFNELNTKAKQLGGYYSSYAKDGAIPGFTFDREEGSKLFMELQEGGVNSTELKQSQEEYKALSRIDQLKAKADRVEAEAKEQLNVERKDNTEKRAREAAHAEQRAVGQMYFARTLRKIAEAMQNGEIKYLDRLQNMTELGDLQGIVSRAKWAFIHAKNMNENYFEMCPEVIDFVKFPLPELWKDHAIKIAYHAQYVKGRKLAAGRWMKRLNAMKEGEDVYTVEGRQALEDFEIVFCTPYKSGKSDYSTWEADKYINQLQTLNRLKRINIDTLAELRASLRELLRIKEGVSTDPEIKRAQELKALERQFIGKKIPGFFPTPEDLGARNLELLDIQEGDTVGEPQAGIGHLAQLIRDQHPNNQLTCIELYSPFIKVLEAKGFTAIHQDFLTYEGKFDKILMNPPFEDLADIDHVIHAYECLNYGGRLVATMAGNKERDHEKVKTFRAFVDMFGTIEEDEPGSFTSAFRPTGVSTVTVVLDKPKLKK